MLYQDMQKTLQDLQKHKAKPAVSIFVKTHRTFPDNDKDAIALKNQLKFAQSHLKQQYDEQTSQQIMQQIHQHTDELNSNYNLDSLAIFASPEQAQLIRFPFDTPERVIINDQFAVRDIVRYLASGVHYYVLVLTREKGRLIEALNDRVIHEFGPADTHMQDVLPHGAFPVVTDSLATTSAAERAVNEENYLKVFINRIDKNLQAMRGQRSLPVIVVGDKRNIGYYREVCDQPAAIIAAVDNVTHLDNAEAQHIVSGVQPALQDYRRQQQKQSMQSLQALKGTAQIRTDLQDIYQAALEGNSATLYVRRGYMLPGHLDPVQRSVVFSNNPDSEPQQNDIVDDLIELVRKNGGQIVFLDPDIMDSQQTLVLATRY